jgi:hypothetical protein
MRKYGFLALIAVLICSIGASVDQSPSICSIARTTFQGWHAYSLTNGLITLRVVPDIGGRAIQFEMGTHAYFFVNPELAGKILPREENDRGHKWANYGGDKDWLGPQGFDAADEWAGPPDYNLDGSAYASEIVKDTPDEVAVRVTSPPDERSGLILSRVYHVERGSSSVRVDHSMQNISAHDVRWGFQEVTQSDTVDPDDRQEPNRDMWAYCPINPHSRFPNGYVPQFGEVRHPAYHVRADGLFALQCIYQVAQVGLDSESGWLAVLNGKTQYAFAERFRAVPGAKYPDDCTVEFWLNAPHRQIEEADRTHENPQRVPFYLETEIISPFLELKPGESGHFQTEWFASRGIGTVINVTEAGTAYQPLKIDVTASSKAHLSGTFGVFYLGTAEISLKSHSGEVLQTISLEKVSPEQLLRVDRELQLPDGTWRVSLNVRDFSGRNRGELGNLLVEPHGSN